MQLIPRKRSTGACSQHMASLSGEMSDADSFPCDKGRLPFGRSSLAARLRQRAATKNFFVLRFAVHQAIFLSLPPRNVAKKNKTKKQTIALEPNLSIVIFNNISPSILFPPVKAPLCSCDNRHRTKCHSHLRHRSTCTGCTGRPCRDSIEEGRGSQLSSMGRI